jgi:hypothetical protein
LQERPKKQLKKLKQKLLLKKLQKRPQNKQPKKKLLKRRLKQQPKKQLLKNKQQKRPPRKNWMLIIISRMMLDGKERHGDKKKKLNGL